VNTDGYDIVFTVMLFLCVISMKMLKEIFQVNIEFWDLYTNNTTLSYDRNEVCMIIDLSCNNLLSIANI
jgi:hypothetical protein